mmetsp:Transcript_31711/g.106836  ORF Transcript_31711/g.106836 Transcript_31711/m.106836 type:complete len:255 (-) Transcript_31711:3015-3779(-)
MEALFRNQNLHQKVLLLAGRHNLVPRGAVVVRDAALVAAEAFAELVYEIGKRQVGVRVQVRKLSCEYFVVVRVRAGLVQDVEDGLAPGAGDLGDLIFRFGVLEMHGRSSQIKQHQDKEADVANGQGVVQEVDQLLAVRHLEHEIGEEEDRLRLCDQVRDLLLFEDVGVVQVHRTLLRVDALDQLVLHAVVVRRELAAVVDSVLYVPRAKEDDVFRGRVLEAGHKGDALVEERRGHLDDDAVDPHARLATVYGAP